MHFTPTSASWLNAVEGWFSQLERRSIYRGVFSSVKELRDEIHRFIKVHNTTSAKPFKWTKSAAKIIESVQRAKQSANITGKN
jgi:transposase